MKKGNKENKENIKKRLAIESIVAWTLLGSLFALIYYLSLTQEEMQQQEQALEVEVAQLSTERSALQGKYDNTTKNIDIYQEALAKNPDTGFADRQLLQDRFNQFQTRFSLGALKLTIGSAKDMSEPKMKKEHMVGAASELVISYDTTLDENAYSLLNTLQRELLGIPKITYFKVMRGEPLNEKALVSIASQGSYPLIKVDAKVSLLGIKPPDNPKPKKPDAP